MLCVGTQRILTFRKTHDVSKSYSSFALNVSQLDIKASHTHMLADL